LCRVLIANPCGHAGRAFWPDPAHNPVRSRFPHQAPAGGGGAGDPALPLLLPTSSGRRASWPRGSAWPCRPPLEDPKPLFDLLRVIVQYHCALAIQLELGEQLFAFQRFGKRVSMKISCDEF